MRVKVTLILKVAIFLRQMYLSVYRRDAHYENFSSFYMKNRSFYLCLLSELNSRISEENTNNFNKSQLQRKRLPLIQYFFFPNTLYKRDLLCARNILEKFIEKMDSDSKDNKEEIVPLGKAAEVLYWGTFHIKLNRFQKEKILHIEHYGQNYFINNKYYSVKELMKLLNL